MKFRYIVIGASAFAAGAAVTAIATLSLLPARYDLRVAAGGSVYKIDRLFGDVTYCFHGTCEPVSGMAPQLTDPQKCLPAEQAKRRADEIRRTGAGNPFSAYDNVCD